MTITNETVVDAIAEVLAARGDMLLGEVELLAVTEMPGAAMLRNGSGLHIGALAQPQPGQPRAWVLTIPVDQASALAELVAEAYARLQDPSPPVAAKDGDMVLARTTIAPGEELRAIMMDGQADAPGGFALWRVSPRESGPDEHTMDVVLAPINRAHELSNMVRAGIASLGSRVKSGGGTVH